MPKITAAGGPSSALGRDPDDDGAEAAPAPESPPAPAAPKAAKAVPVLSGSGGVTVPKAGTGGA